MADLIFEKTYIKITFFKEKELAEMVWTGKSTHEEYIEAYSFILDFMNKGNKITKHISDIHKQSVVSPETRRWFQDVALPKAVELGLKKSVIISDNNPFKQYYINLVLKLSNKFPVDVKIVVNNEEAEAFLFKV